MNGNRKASSVRTADSSSRRLKSALSLLNIVWHGSSKDSWGRINYSMRQALTLAIGAGLHFRSSHFRIFASRFRWQYWVTNSTEWIYSDAVINGNVSCIEAYEQWTGRRPFRANNVKCHYTMGGFIHRNNVDRQRERLVVGFICVIDGRTWHVTGFDDNAGEIRLATYATGHRDGKPIKLLALTNEQVAAHFPAPKKSKSAKTAEETD